MLSNLFYKPHWEEQRRSKFTKPAEKIWRICFHAFLHFTQKEVFAKTSPKAQRHTSITALTISTSYHHHRHHHHRSSTSSPSFYTLYHTAQLGSKKKPERRHSRDRKCRHRESNATLAKSLLKSTVHNLVNAQIFFQSICCSFKWFSTATLYY